MDFKGQYLTYEEYKALGGNLDIMPFKLLEFEARQNIDKYTFGRLKDLEEQTQDVKICEFELIKTIESYDKYELNNKAISSETIDGYSVSYQTPTESITKTKSKEICSIIKDYLVDCKLEDGTPYLYRGRK